MLPVESKDVVRRRMPPLLLLLLPERDDGPPWTWTGGSNTDNPRTSSECSLCAVMSRRSRLLMTATRPPVHPAMAMFMSAPELLIVPEEEVEEVDSRQQIAPPPFARNGSALRSIDHAGPEALISWATSRPRSQPLKSTYGLTHVSPCTASA
jgi:hypothetical protein